jgi:hypothetical protein
MAVKGKTKQAIKQEVKNEAYAQKTNEALFNLIMDNAPRMITAGDELMAHVQAKYAALKAVRAAEAAKAEAAAQAQAQAQSFDRVQTAHEPIKVELVITIRLEDARQGGKVKSKVKVK